MNSLNPKNWNYFTKMNNLEQLIRFLAFIIITIIHLYFIDDNWGATNWKMWAGIISYVVLIDQTIRSGRTTFNYWVLREKIDNENNKNA